MGYMSEVALVIKSEDKARLVEAIKNYDSSLEKNSEKTALQVLADVEKVVINNEYHVYYWECIKWYEDYPYIKFFTNEIMYEKYGISYDFLRVGEDNEDIEEDYKLNTGILRVIVDKTIGFDL